MCYTLKVNHQPHCTELNAFVEVLTKRLERTTKETPGVVAKKERQLGAPSTSDPPKGAPGWAIKGIPTPDSEREAEGWLLQSIDLMIAHMTFGTIMHLQISLDQLMNSRSHVRINLVSNVVHDGK